MEMRHLRLVRTLATEGTLTAAGKRLYLSQSALSHQLREIEDEFGIRLFDRCKKRMVLTPAGERVLDAADIVLGEIDDVRDEITRMVSGESGILRIAACRYTGFHWLPTTDAIIEMVKAGMGVAAMNLWSVRPHLESTDLRAIRLTRNGYRRTRYAAVPNGAKQTPFISHFIGFLTLSQN